MTTDAGEIVVGIRPGTEDTHVPGGSLAEQVARRGTPVGAPLAGGHVGWWQAGLVRPRSSIVVG